MRIWPTSVKVSCGSDRKIQSLQTSLSASFSLSLSLSLSFSLSLSRPSHPCSSHILRPFITHPHTHTHAILPHTHLLPPLRLILVHHIITYTTIECTIQVGRSGTPSLSYQQVSDKRSKLDPWKHGLCFLLPGGSPKDEYPWLRSAGERTKARKARNAGHESEAKVHPDTVQCARHPAEKGSGSAPFP